MGRLKKLWFSKKRSMRTGAVRFRCFILGLTLSLLAGCASLSTFQTPQVLEKGKTVIGLAGSGVNGSAPGILEASGRIGLGHGTDAGLKVTLPGTLTADFKWQWFRGVRVNAALDLALSYFNSSNDGEDFKSTALMPTLLLGNRHWYAGGRVVFMSADGTITFFGSHDFELTNVFPGLFLGFAIGNRFQVLPEINAYFPREGSFVIWGIGLRYAF